MLARVDDSLARPSYAGTGTARAQIQGLPQILFNQRLAEFESSVALQFTYA